MPQLKRNSALFGVIENYYNGTAADHDGLVPTLSGTDFLPMLDDWTCEAVYLDAETREINSGGQVLPHGPITPSHWEYSFSFYLRGIALISTVPEFDPFIKAAGHSIASDNYSPDIATWAKEAGPSNDSSVYFELFEDGIKKVAKGGRNNMKISTNANEDVIITFEGLAIYSEPTAGSAYGSAASHASLGARIKARDCGLKFGTGNLTATNVRATTFEFDAGNEVVADADLNSAGAKMVVIASRKPTITTDLEFLDTFANYNFWTEVAAGTLEAASQIEFKSGTQYNNFRLTFTGQWVNVPTGERSGKLTADGIVMDIVSATADEDYDLLIVQSSL